MEMREKTSKRTWDEWLFGVLWTWLSIKTLLPWLVTFRLTLEGNSYSWGTEYFGRQFYSSGLARLDFLLVYALLAASLLVLYQLRKQHFKLAAPLLVSFLGVFAADALYEFVYGDPVIFQGDTLGVTVNVSIPFFVLQFGMLALALAWWIGVRDVAQGPGPQPLAKYRRAILATCIAAVPVQVVLLVVGEAHALTDELGVIATLLQGALLAYAFYPGKDYRR